MTQPLTVKLVARRHEAEGICSFVLADPAGRALPAFTAGAHIDVHLPAGLVRQYSLCNDPARPEHYEICVQREPASRGGSVAMHDLRPGQELRIGEPRNLFPLAEHAPHHLLIAGGIGITPLMSMAHRLAHIGASFELHHAARSLARMALVERIRSCGFADRVHLHLGDGSTQQKLHIDALLGAQPAGTHLYVCGPGRLMQAALDAAQAAGWAQDRVHREFFAGATSAPAEADGFEVQIASTGRVVAVGAAQTVVQALAAAGIGVPVSCEQGVCGTCLTRVIDGTPDHRDLFLTEQEKARNDQFTPCCSRAKSARLVLGL